MQKKYSDRCSVCKDGYNLDFFERCTKKQEINGEIHSRNDFDINQNLVESSDALITTILLPIFIPIGFTLLCVCFICCWKKCNTNNEENNNKINATNNNNNNNNDNNNNNQIWNNNTNNNTNNNFFIRFFRNNNIIKNNINFNINSNRILQAQEIIINDNSNLKINIDSSKDDLIKIEKEFEK